MRISDWSSDVCSSDLLRAPACLGIEEDQHGVTLWQEYVEPVALTGPFLARALGRFAGTPLPAVSWLARNQLADRLDRLERRGGRATLSLTPVADVAGARSGRLLIELPPLICTFNPVFSQNKNKES